MEVEALKLYHAVKALDSRDEPPPWKYKFRTKKMESLPYNLWKLPSLLKQGGFALKAMSAL